MMPSANIDKAVAIMGRIAAVLVVVFIAALLLIQPPHVKPPQANPTAVDVEHGHEPSPQPTLEIPQFGQSGPPMGYQPNPDATEKFLQSLDKPTIREAGPELFRPRGPPGATTADEDAEKGVFLYRAMQKWYAKKYGREWVVEQQQIGDCVSWGWAHGVAIHLAVMCELGHSAEFEFPATEAIYGGARVEARGLNGDGMQPRGGYSDGSYGAAAAKFLTNWGVCWRREYQFANLVAYSGERAKEWGAYGCGGRGDRGRADEAAKTFPVRSVALVRTYEEAAAAIRSGYPVPVCSLQGFRSTRDRDGFAAPSGTWAHCMCFIAVRSDRAGLLCLNSWGPNWISGGKFPPDQPDGSFWVDAQTCNRMLAGGDSFAVSGLEGFPFQELNNGDWVHSWNKPEETQYALSP